MTEKHDVLSFFDPYGSNPAAAGRAGRLVFAGTRWGEASLGKRYPEAAFYKAFAPRVGFAYTVSQKTVVRAGYGVFFTQLYYTNWTGGIGGGLDGFNSTPSFSAPTAASLRHSIFRTDFRQCLPANNHHSLTAVSGRAKVSGCIVAPRTVGRRTPSNGT